MKKAINLLVLLLLCVVTASAQKYDVKCLRGDSVAVYDLIETIHTDNTFYKKGEKVMFYLHNGEQVEGVDKFYDGGGMIHVGSSVGYAVIQKDGKKYCTLSENLIFSEDNPDSAEDKVLSSSDKLAQSFQGRIFYSIIPYLIIAFLFLCVMVLNFLATRNAAVRSIAVVAIPACVMVGTLLEIWAYRVLGTECFWWCDNSRYGFFGSLLRIVPFGFIVFYQIMSIKFYEPVILGEAFDGEVQAFDGDVKTGISVKPALISILAAVPVLIITALVFHFLGVKGTVGDVIAVVCFFLALGIGILLSLKRNVKLMKSKRLGLLLTLFAIVYILGCIVAVWGLVVVIFKLIVQILIVAFVIGCVMYAMSDATGSGGGGGSTTTYRTVYYDADNKAHDSSYACDKANEEIAKREAGKN